MGKEGKLALFVIAGFLICVTGVSLTAGLDAPVNLVPTSYCPVNGPWPAWPITVEFSWDRAPGAEWYVVEVYNSNGEWMPGKYVYASQCKFPESCEDKWINFPPGTTHWWVVFAGGGGAVSAPSEVNSFTTYCGGNCPCTAPPQTSPPEETPSPTYKTCISDPKFNCEKIINWNPYVGDDFVSYAILLSLGPSFEPNAFSCIVGDITLQEQSYYILKNLPPNIPYYYRVLVGSTGNNPDFWQGLVYILESGDFTIPDADCQLKTEKMYTTCICHDYRADVMAQTDGSGGTMWFYANKQRDTAKCGGCFYTTTCPNNGDSATV